MSEAGTLLENVVRFTRLLRAAGLPVGPGRGDRGRPRGRGGGAVRARPISTGRCMRRW